jgi:fucose permease
MVIPTLPIRCHLDRILGRHDSWTSVTWIPDRKTGEFKAVVAYIAISNFLELIFWLVPSLNVSSVSVAFLGFFLRPLFPTAMVFVTKLMPKHLHVGSVRFAAAFGGSGGAIFPFIVGAIAPKGVKSLQPVILALLGGIAAL